MPARRVCSEIRLVNGSTGDPVLYVDYPGHDDALLFDGGDNTRLPRHQLADLRAVFVTHHHVDHFIGIDRIMRENIDSEKTLTIFGPEGTIRKIYDRIKSYEYQFFPFQKITVRVTELLSDSTVTALLECRRRFPEPARVSQPWDGEPIFENAAVTVEATHVDHTVPCLSYAFVEKPGWRLDTKQLETGLLRPGPWIQQVSQWLDAGADADTTIDIAGGQFSLRRLAEQYFRRSEGARVAFVTDTAWSEMSKPRLLQLARGANLLYCDSFYLESQRKQAERHRHMTAEDAGRFAAEAGVEELVLLHFSKRYTGRYQKLIDEARQYFPQVTADLEPND